MCTARGAFVSSFGVSASELPIRVDPKPPLVGDRRADSRLTFGGASSDTRDRQDRWNAEGPSGRKRGLRRQAFGR